MSDRSLPTGDQVDGPPPFRPGPAMARQALAGRTPPAEFVEKVVERAHHHGWHVHRCEGGRPGSDVAFPVLILVREAGMIAAHVGGREPTFKQAVWLHRLGRVEGVTVCVWLAKDGLDPVDEMLRRGDTDGGRRDD